MTTIRFYREFVLFIYILSFISSITSDKLPNFIFILTDDQDYVLGGSTPMLKTRHLIKDQGAEFTNMFVTTPLCCPSRASILTGRYAHNHGVRNNSVSGNCNSLWWQKKQEPYSFISYLKKAGYSTFYAGKYLNQYGTKSTGGVNHVPIGWDNWIGLVGNSVYYNYSLSVNGNEVKHGSDPYKDYLTNVVMNESVKFLSKQNSSVPFFLFVSPPSPHAPFTPHPNYSKNFSNYFAPRPPNFNMPAKDKHWLLRQAPSPLSDEVIQTIDEVFRNRWRTLLSVDNGVEMIIHELKKKKLLKNTYIFFSSDNGFHLGEFSLPWDKRQLYEFDIRIPLYVRGPGIKARTKISYPVLNIDLAATFLDLANVSGRRFDGQSFAFALNKPGAQSGQRSQFIVEHKGEATDGMVPGCPQYRPHEVHTCELSCICEDATNNSYWCVRELDKTKNFMTCIFEDQQNFREAYNLTEDPFQMKNIFSVSKNADALLKRVLKYKPT